MLANVSYVTVLQKIVRLAFDQECKSFVQVENRLLPKIVRHTKNSSRLQCRRNLQLDTLSSQIEQKKLSVVDCLDLQNLFLTGGSAVARAQERAAEHSGTARHLYPGAAIRVQAKHCLLFRRQTSRPDIDILMHRDGTIASILRSNESPCALTLMERESLLFITRH